MTAFVALLRGINVGGHHKIRMDELKELHESLGFKDVFTYIQSGNVVFTSDEVDAARLRRQIEDGVEKRYGFHIEVLVRSENELREIIEKNPFASQQSKDPKWVLVLFLVVRPDDVAQEDFLKMYAGPEEIFFHGKEVYIYYTNGIGRSKLSHSLLEKRLKTVGTARNVNTLLQLQKMMQH